MSSAVGLKGFTQLLTSLSRLKVLSLQLLTLLFRLTKPMISAYGADQEHLEHPSTEAIVKGV